MTDRVDELKRRLKSVEEMTDKQNAMPPHKQLYQDIFDWCHETGSLPLESEIGDLINIVSKGVLGPGILQGIIDGRFAVVPVDPTEKMIAGGIKSGDWGCYEQSSELCDGDPKQVYSAMIKAAQEEMKGKKDE